MSNSPTLSEKASILIVTGCEGLKIAVDYLNEVGLSIDDPSDLIPALRKLVDAGDAQAAHSLSELAFYHLGADLSLAEMMSLTEFAASRAIHAASVLRFNISTGTTSFEAFKQEAHWLIEAENANYAPAALALAMIYEGAFSVPANPEESKRHLAIAVTLGSVQALAYAGLRLTHEPGNDVKLGVDYLLRASELGNKDALQFLEDAYRLGDFGFPRNKDIADAYAKRLAIVCKPYAALDRSLPLIDTDDS